MVYEELKKKYKKIIGWGASGAYDKYGKSYEQYISYIIDSNPLKWDTEIGTVKIKSPDHLLKENSTECVIVIFSDYVDEIRESIKEKGNFDVISGRHVFEFCERKVDLYHNRKIQQVFSKVNTDNIVCDVGTITYITAVAGGAKFVAEQSRILETKGYEVFHIVPIQYYQAGNEDEMIWIIYKEKSLGVYTLNEIIPYINRCKNMIIHSPWYAVPLIKKIYNQMEQLHKCLFYLHDFACVCNKHFLPVEDQNCFEELAEQCVNCKDRQGRMKLYQEYTELFQNNNVLVIAPSQIIFDKVSQVYPKAHYEVIPHYVYELQDTSKKVNDKLKIAFVGSALKVKGWEEFKKIVHEFKDVYEFYCFGKCTDRIENVKYVDVYIEGTEGQLCMKDALEKYEIDMAFLDSIVCETYSFTYIETFESGTYVLTTERSGNICEAVRGNDNGYVAKNIDDMIEFLRKDDIELKNLIRQQNKKIVNKTFNLKFLDYMCKDRV